MYVKLFSSILASSIWSEDVTTRLTWIALLAMSDPDGFVRGSDDGLARMANIPLPEFQRALDILSASDTRRPGQEFDGRRIERTLEGVVLLNYCKYRELKDVDVRREQTRDRVRRFRERAVTQDVTLGNAPKRQEEEETEAEADSTTTTTRGVLRFDTPEHQQVYDGLRRASRSPSAFDATLRGIEQGMTDGKPVTRAQLGAALLEMAAKIGSAHV